MTNFNYVFLIPDGNFYIEWSAEDVGFGIVTIEVDGSVTIKSESMGKEFVKELFCKLVDNAIIDT